MKNQLLISIGMFSMIFGVDGILFLESAVPECSGFTGMGWFVFITMGFDPRAILSNTECLTSFYIQTLSGTLFLIGFGLVGYLIIKRHKTKFNGNLLKNES